MEKKKKHQTTTNLQIEQFNNGWSVKELEDGNVTSAEVIEFTSKTTNEFDNKTWHERLGRIVAADLGTMMDKAASNVADITYTITTTEG
jgi:uncharacterized protein (DUF1919 family)